MHLLVFNGESTSRYSTLRNVIDDLFLLVVREKTRLNGEIPPEERENKNIRSMAERRDRLTRTDDSKMVPNFIDELKLQGRKNVFFLSFLQCITFVTVHSISVDFSKKIVLKIFFESGFEIVLFQQGPRKRIFPLSLGVLCKYRRYLLQINEEKYFSSNILWMVHVRGGRPGRIRLRLRPRKRATYIYTLFPFYASSEKFSD